MKKQKGGLEGIIALIILSGIVIALIIAVVLPMANSTKGTGEAANTKVTELEGKIRGSSVEG